MPNDPTPHDREPLPISSLAVVEIAIISMVLFGVYFYIEALYFYALIGFAALAMVSTPSSNKLAYSVFMREIVIDDEAPLKSLVSGLSLFGSHLASIFLSTSPRHGLVQKRAFFEICSMALSSVLSLSTSPICSTIS
ncbi:MAG: hypothetical protein KU28_09955 [Sulfurovum sp. PC08-66]|nr:MAG: hypothetical protein KU28_09955 [Sulfurovum sp. PC08-66]